jgi:hypothetical protein
MRNTLLFFIVGFGLFGCTKKPQPPTHPLDKMVVAYKGNHSRSTIQARMDEVMTMYGLSISEEEYTRAGSVLVSLRKKFGPHEMEILTCMKAAHNSNVKSSFPEMAAVCVASLAQ